MLKIEIEIDESLLSNAVKKIFAEQFAPQRFGKELGIEMIEKQVQDFVREMDFTPQIQAAAKAKRDDVVNQVVEQTLRDTVRKKAKQMKADGSLFP